MADAALILNTPQDTYNNIKKHGENVLLESLVTSPKDLMDTIKFLDSCSNMPGVSKEVSELKTDCFNILKEKIKLTKFVFNVTSNNQPAIIPTNSQLNLNLENQTKEVKESPEQTMARTEVKSNVIKHDFTKKSKDTEQKTVTPKPVENLEKGLIGEFEDDKQKTVLTPNSTSHEVKQSKVISFSAFNGYIRKAVFGTAVELPEIIQKLIPTAETESDIDNIARHLINEGRVEDALNLSIDLFEKSKTSSKLQQEVEKRFLFEILPWAHGVQVDPKTDMQNISLSIWNDQLKQKALSEVKETETTVGLTLETLRNECINMFKANPDSKTIFKEVKAFFDKEVNNVVDEGFDKNDKGVFANIVIEFKKSQKTVEDAEKAAYAEKDTTPTTTLTKDEIKSQAKSIVAKALEAGQSAMNALRKYMREKSVSKTMGPIKVEEYYKQVESEVKEENPTLKNPSKEKKILMKNFKIEDTNPDVWDSAKLCKNLTEFKDLLITIVFDKTEHFGKNAWQVAANLANQYMNNLEESKSWDDTKKLAFFTGLIKGEAERRKKDKIKDAVTTDAVIVEETIVSEDKTGNPTETTVESNVETAGQENTVTTTEEVVTEQEKVEIAKAEVAKAEATKADSSINLKKYEAISNEKNTNKIHQLIADFLLETNYKTYPERVEELDKYLIENKKWARAPKQDRDNVIKKVISNNPKVQELVK